MKARPGFDRRRLAAGAVFLGGLMFAVCAAAQPAPVSIDRPGPAGVTPAELTAFLQRLQHAVASGRAQAVADLTAFPLRVNSGPGKSRRLNRAQFIAAYAQVFTPAVAAAVAAQDPAQMFQRADGAMVGEGQVWLAPVCADTACTQSAMRVVSVNLPAP